MINKITKAVGVFDKDSAEKKLHKVYKKSFLAEQRFFYILISTGVLLLITLFYLMLTIKTDQPLEPIRYSYLFGITKTGSWVSLFLPFVVSLVAIAMNLVFANY